MEVKDLIFMPTNVAGLLVALEVCENLEAAYKLCEDRYVFIHDGRMPYCIENRYSGACVVAFTTNHEHYVNVDNECVAIFRV